MNDKVIAILEQVLITRYIRKSSEDFIKQAEELFGQKANNLMPFHTDFLYYFDRGSFCFNFYAFAKDILELSEQESKSSNNNLLEASGELEKVLTKLANIYDTGDRILDYVKLGQNYVKLKSRNQELREEGKAITEECSELRLTNSRLKEANFRLLGDIEKLRKTIYDSDQAITDLKTEIKGLEELRSQKGEANTELAQEINYLRRQNYNLKLALGKTLNAANKALADVQE